ncbi:MAG: hypothetical protein IKU42_00015 [Oscillospiraceae bacterium]|nr:hypothetical protein [Oscillospiraceae bacterium]
MVTDLIISLTLLGLMISIIYGIIVFLSNIFKSPEKAPAINYNKSRTPVQDAKYDRNVHHMHTKDAATERRHRLDQLKSLYEAGMMEKDEYYERVEAVETDYRGR